MKRMIVISLAMCFFFASQSGKGSVHESTVVKANKAYAAGLYAEAAGLYKRVADAGYESPELFYNLGNAFFKQNDFTHAILWYERALKLDPGNEDISFNLNVANTKIADKIEPLPELFYKRWYYGLVRLMPVDTWALAGVVLFITSLLGLVLYQVSRVLVLRKAGFWSAAVLLFLSAGTLVLAWSGYRSSYTVKEAVLVAPTITVKSSPDEKSTDLFVLHEGTKVRLTDRINDWYEIRIANGSVGWLPQSALETL